MKDISIYHLVAKQTSADLVLGKIYFKYFIMTDYIGLSRLENNQRGYCLRELNISFRKL